MSYFTLKNGDNMYYETFGEGRDIVLLLPGYTDSHTIFSQTIQRLKNKATCLIIDYRSHGKSKESSTDAVTIDTLTGNLHELMEGLNVKDVTLVGWSMGASVAFTYINRYGCDHLRQVVICDMPPKLLNCDGWHLGLSQATGTAQKTKQDDEAVFALLYTESAAGIIPRFRRRLRFWFRHLLKKRQNDGDEAILKSLYHSMLSQDNRTVVKNITVPFIYFYASPGSLFSPELALWYKVYVHCPYKAVKFSNSSHMLMTEQPKKFADEIEKLLAH